MNTGDERRLEQLFHEAAALPKAERDAFVARATAANAPLGDRLRRLLAHGDEATPVYLRSQAQRPAELADPTTIDRYRIVDRIGEGGMGVVYVAEQSEPVRRRVALKVIRAGLDTEVTLARFAAERQALALMDHPNIAHIYDAGATAAGRPYYVMEYTPGLTLLAYCARHGLDVAARLELFVQVCDAVQHAHQRGVIHRDLKPQNVLVTLQSDVPMPKVIDFGIARPAAPGSDTPAHTQSGEVVGTFDYMSPEQADGRDVDTRTDIWSLGVLLYELLTDARPFGDAPLHTLPLAQIRAILREREPVRPSARVGAHSPRHRQLRGDLDWIVLQALAKERARRYASASELAADVRRHRRGDAVLASPPTVRYRVGKFVRRHRVAVAAATAVVIALAIGVVGLAIGLQRATSEKALADRRADDLRLQLYATNTALAHEALQRGDAEAVARLLAACPADQRGFEWQWLAAAARRATHIARLPGAVGLSLASHRDAARVLVGTASGEVLVVDAVAGPVVARTTAAADRVTTLQTDDARSVVLAGSDDGAWVLLDAVGLQRLATVAEPTEQVRAAALSPDGRDVALLRSDQSIEVLTVADGRRRRLSPPRRDSDFGLLRYAPDGSTLAVAGDRLLLLAVERGEPIAEIDEPRRQWRADELPGYRPRVLALAFAHDGHRLAVAIARSERAPGGPANRWELRDARTLALQEQRPGEGSMPVRSALFTAGDRELVAGSTGQLCRVPLHGDQAPQRSPGHDLPIVAVCEQADGSLASLSDDQVAIWPAAQPREPDAGDTWPPFGRCVWSANRTSVAVPVWLLAGALVHDSATFALQQALVMPRAPNRVLALDDDAGFAVATATGADATVVDLATGVVRRPLAGAADLALGCLLGERGTFVGADAAGTVTAWRLDDGARLATCGTAASGPVAALVVAPGATVLVVRRDGSLATIDDRLACCELPATAPRDVAMAVCHPDGVHLLTVDAAGCAVVADLRDGRRRTLRDQGALDLDVSPDGSRVAIVDRRGVHLHDFASGARLLTALQGSAGIAEARFRRHGRGLVGVGTRLVAWDLEVDAATQAARAAAREARDAWLLLRRRHVATDAMRPHVDDLALAADARAALLRLFERLGDCPFELNHDAWERVLRPNLPGDDYRYALVAAETAARLLPRPAFLNTLATANLRAGNHERAAAVAAATIATARAEGRAPLAFDLAVLAMARCRLGDRAAATAVLDELHAALRDPAQAADPQVWLLVREAEATLGAR